MNGTNERMSRSANKFRFFPLASIIVVSVLVYLNALDNTFVYDDYQTITNNHFIRDWKYLSSFLGKKYFVVSNELTYRPIVTLSYFLDYAVWQLRPVGYHLANVVIHAINVTFVYCIAYRLFYRRSAAAVSALLFSIHPVFTEAVNAVSYREDLLSTAFALAAFILFLKSCKNSTARNFIVYYTLSCCAYFCALLSKEMAITLPLLCLLYNLFFPEDRITGRRQRLLRQIMAKYGGYVAVSAFYLYLRFRLFYNPGESVAYPGNSGWINFMVMAKVVGYYLKLMFIPMPLNADYVTPLVSRFGDAAFAVSMLTVVAVLVVLLRQYRLSKTFTFSVLWFFVALLPVLNIVPIYNVMAERYLYFPGIGFALLAGSVISQTGDACRAKRYLRSPGGNTPPWKTDAVEAGIRAHPGVDAAKGTSRYRFFFASCAIIVVSLFAWGTISRNRVWLNEFTFSTETLRRSPASFRMYNDLGYFYYQTGNIGKAIQAFKDSIRVQFNQPKAHCNLGAAYSLRGHDDAAIEELKIAVQLMNPYPEAHNNLGILYRKKGMLDLAVNEYRETLKANPYHAEARNNLGSVLMDLGRLDEALFELEKAVRVRRDFVLAHYNIAVVYFKKGEIEKAFYKLLEAYRLDPANADVHASLGAVYRDYFHDKEKMLFHLREALRLNPRHKQAGEMRAMLEGL